MNHKKRWCVYIVRCADETLYTGISNDYHQRIAQHNQGDGAKYTRSRTPVVLNYLRFGQNRSEVSQWEYQIKKLSRTQKEKLIISYKDQNQSTSTGMV